MSYTKNKIAFSHPKTSIHYYQFMSSSRSIAAARNRRVNEPPKPPIAQQQQMKAPIAQQLKAQIKTQQQQQEQPVHQPIGKMTISDAIGLITIRLGRVEQKLTTTPVSETPPNSQLVDNSVFETILNRLELLEKREKMLVDELKTFKEVTNERFLDIDEAFVSMEQEEPEKQEEPELEQSTVELLIEEETHD
jgi:hypothetical protein